MEDAAGEVALAVGVEVGAEVGSAEEEGSALLRVVVEKLVPGWGEGLEGLAGVSVGALCAHDDVEELVGLWLDGALLEGQAAGGGDVEGTAGGNEVEGVLGGVVEGVAHDEGADEFAGAVAKLLGAHALDGGLAEVLLASAEARGVDAGYAGVLVEAEALEAVVDEGVGGCQAREGVDDERVGGSGLGTEHGAELLAGQAGSALVDSFDAEAVEDARLGGDEAGGLGDGCAVVPAAVALLLVDDVAGGSGGGFEGVVGGPPGEAYVAVDGFGHGGEGLDGERLDGDGVGAVHLGRIAQDGLVDGAGEVELEGGVVAEAEVGEVLVAEHLEDDAGDAWHACLAVVLVPGAAHGPLAVEAGEVGAYLLVELGGEAAGGLALESAGIESVLEVGGVEGEGADEVVVAAESGIAVEGEGEFEGYAESAVARQVDGASGEVVGGHGSGVDVVGIVAAALAYGVDLVGHAVPLL